MALDKNKIIAEATKLVQKGAYDKAIKTYERILQEDPKDVRVLLKVGELYQKKGDDRMAADAFKRVAETYADQGFFLKSVAVYKQVVKLDAEDLRVNERLAALYQQLGLLSEAMGQFQLIAAAHEKAGDGARLLDALKRMVELDPENIGSVVRLGKLYQGANQPGPALEHYRRAAASLKAHNRADDYLKVAERIVELAPNDLALTRELANIYMAKGDTKRALAKLQVSFKADGRDVETLNLLAQAFRDLGQNTKTVQVFKTLADVHEREGRRGEALNAWRKVAELAPGDPDATRVLAEAQAEPIAPAPPSQRRAPSGAPPAPAMPLGTPVAKVAVAPPLQAFTSPRPAAAPAPEPPQAPPVGVEGIPKLLTEADVYLKYGLTEKAIGHLRAVLAIDPETPAALEKLRDLHQGAGRRADAIEAAELAVRAALAKGDVDRARGSLLRLRQLDPGHPELGELAVATGATEEIELSASEVEEELEPGELPATPAELEMVDEPSQVMSDDSLAEMSAGAGGDEVIEEEPAEPPAPELDLEGPDAELLRTAMASLDSDEVMDEVDGDALPELGEEPAEEPRRRGAPAAVIEAPDEPADLPAARAPAPPPRRAAPAHADLTDELEEADFFAQQGLLADAREVLLHLQTLHAGHPVLEARIADVDRRLAARAAPPPAPARPSVPAAPSATARARPAARAPQVPAPAVEPRSARQSPSLIEPSAADGASFDLGADLAEELDRAPDLGGLDDEFQYSVEDVFNQFKRGVAETVTAEDSDTHYDLGIAYKEMGLVDDAVNEFETALRGSNRKKEIDSLSMIALCRMSQGRPGDAVEPLRRALRSDYLTKESAKALHYELGVALEEQGEREQALWCFQKVSRVEPNYRDTVARVASLGGGPGRPPDGMAAPAARQVVGPGRPAVIPAATPRAAPAAATASQPPVASPPGPKKNIGFL